MTQAFVIWAPNGKTAKALVAAIETKFGVDVMCCTAKKEAAPNHAIWTIGTGVEPNLLSLIQVWAEGYITGRSE